jgi:hypothetical protein
MPSIWRAQARLPLEGQWFYTALGSIIADIKDKMNGANTALVIVATALVFVYDPADWRCFTAVSCGHEIM